jgi:8-oxo-dGTP pyrophosphatase MutT (NUDIX family)
MFHQNSFEPGENSPQRDTLVPVIDVPTSTCILYDPEDPHMVLVGLSHKHSRPVLPGGKIDAADLVGINITEAAKVCIVREIKEEIGVEITSVELFDIVCHGDSDVRSVSASTLKDTLVSSEVSQVLPDMLVTARYGNPDYIFIGRVAPKDITPSAELYQLGFIDIRCIPSDALGAGHSEIIERYRNQIKDMGL